MILKICQEVLTSLGEAEAVYVDALTDEARLYEGSHVLRWPGDRTRAAERTAAARSGLADVFVLVEDVLNRLLPRLTSAEVAALTGKRSGGRPPGEVPLWQRTT